MLHISIRHFVKVIGILSISRCISIMLIIMHRYLEAGRHNFEVCTAMLRCTREDELRGKRGG